MITLYSQPCFCKFKYDGPCDWSGVKDENGPNGCRVIGHRYYQRTLCKDACSITILNAGYSNWNNSKRCKSRKQRRIRVGVRPRGIGQVAVDVKLVIVSFSLARKSVRHRVRSRFVLSFASITILTRESDIGEWGLRRAA